MWFNEEDDFEDAAAAAASVESVAAAVHATSPTQAPAAELIHTKKLTHSEAELDSIGK
jgi:hypothetical protein